MCEPVNQVRPVIITTTLLSINSLYKQVIKHLFKTVQYKQSCTIYDFLYKYNIYCFQQA